MQFWNTKMATVHHLHWFICRCGCRNSYDCYCCDVLQLWYRRDYQQGEWCYLKWKKVHLHLPSSLLACHTRCWRSWILLLQDEEQTFCLCIWYCPASNLDLHLDRWYRCCRLRRRWQRKDWRWVPGLDWSHIYFWRNWGSQHIIRRSNWILS